MVIAINPVDKSLIVIIELALCLDGAARLARFFNLGQPSKQGWVNSLMGRAPAGFEPDQRMVVLPLRGGRRTRPTARRVPMIRGDVEIYRIVLTGSDVGGILVIGTCPADTAF